MEGATSLLKKILITGGTSGLGYQLVIAFLKKGYHVVATGRKEVSIPEYSEKFSFYKVDFSDLGTTAHIFSQIAEAHQFDILINNAGVLSPPKRAVTSDGMEYTFQVNFLAHLLADEIIIRRQPTGKPLRIASITSPVYKLSRLDTENGSGYRPLKAYSESKLYLALMSERLSDKHINKSITAFSFDPGVFGSGIYRMQGRFFSILYMIAKPFMRSPENVAGTLSEIVTADNISANVIYHLNKHESRIPVYDKNVTDVFWKDCYEKIRPFL